MVHSFTSVDVYETNKSFGPETLAHISKRDGQAEEGVERKEMKKGISTCYVCEPTSHKQCKHYILHTY